MFIKWPAFCRGRSFTFRVSTIAVCLLVVCLLNLCILYDNLSSRVATLYQDGYSERSMRRTYLCLLIFTGIGNVERRDTIRETWISEVTDIPEVIVFFVIGVRDLPQAALSYLTNEKAAHGGDLLLLRELKDDYNSLTRKLSESLVWLDANVKFRYVLKVDDDSFVMLSKVLHALHRMPKERLYWGFFDGRASVKRAGKWAERDWFLCDRYLPYALGGGYALSYDLVKYVARNQALLKHYHNEDISLGAWLSPLDIRRIHEPLFDTEAWSRGCHNDYIVTHKQSVKMMREKWTSLKTNNVLCPKVHRTRPSYIYNWSALPSNCCQRHEGVP